MRIVLLAVLLAVFTSCCVGQTVTSQPTSSPASQTTSGPRPVFKPWQLSMKDLVQGLRDAQETQRKNKTIGPATSDALAVWRNRNGVLPGAKIIWDVGLFELSFRQKEKMPALLAEMEKEIASLEVKLKEVKTGLGKTFLETQLHWRICYFRFAKSLVNKGMAEARCQMSEGSNDWPVHVLYDMRMREDINFLERNGKLSGTILGIDEHGRIFVTVDCFEDNVKLHKGNPRRPPPVFHIEVSTRPYHQPNP